MILPDEIETATRQAMKSVLEHSQHQFLPVDRKQFTDTFFKLSTPVADLTRRWLGVLAAKRVLPLYVEPNYPESYYEKIKRFPPDEWRHLQDRIRLDLPQEAIQLAEQVLRGEFDTDQAGRTASETYSYIGYYKHYQPVSAAFAEIASNRALLEASAPGYSPFQFFDQYAGVGVKSYSDLDWLRDGGNGDAAGYAFIAECSVMYGKKPANVSEYQWWMKSPTFDRQRSLMFWTWWLTEALQEAWENAFQQT